MMTTSEGAPMGYEAPVAPPTPEQDQLAEGWEVVSGFAERAGSVVAEAFGRAYEAAGGVSSPDYHNDLSSAEAELANLEPDVLFVDLQVRERSWRHPLPGAVRETVRRAGWIILERDLPRTAADDADKPQNAEPSEPVPSSSNALLDELMGGPEDGQDDDQFEPEMQPLDRELVVLQDNGSLIRLVCPPIQEQGPMRYARISRKLPAKDQKTLGEYLEENRDSFFEPDVIESIPGQENRFSPHEVYVALYKFLENRDLVEPQQ